MFYRGKMFHESFQGGAFIGQRGSESLEVHGLSRSFCAVQERSAAGKATDF